MKRNEGLDYAVVKNTADLRKYIDNDYPASMQDMIETDWNGESPLYQFRLPSDGTLLVAVLADQGYAKGEIYRDTATIKKNGDYVARLEAADGLDVMVPFTVSGVVEKTLLAPTTSPVPLPGKRFIK